MAAVAAAKGEGNPPALLAYAWSCQKWNIPPIGGGMDLQSYKRITLMGALDNIYHAVKHVRSLDGENIKYMSIDEGRIIAALRKDKLM